MTVSELIRELSKCEPDAEITLRVLNLESTTEIIVKELDFTTYKQVYIFS
jgi:hypothetical protein